MKNLLIYLNRDGNFDEETSRLVRLQIDNSFEVGWEPEDLILVTNFPYRYRSVNAFVVKKGFCDFKKECTKITALTHLFDIGFFGSDLYWCHDFDAYQQEPISKDELNLDEYDGGFCDYCRVPLWQLGSFFFKKGAEDIFREIASRMSPKLDLMGHQLYDEYVMKLMTDENFNNINERILKLNTSYDFGMRRVDYCYSRAVKPLKILHFHPHNPILNTLSIAMYGKNRLNQPLMNERLIKLFNKHGIK